MRTRVGAPVGFGGGVPLGRRARVGRRLLRPEEFLLEFLPGLQWEPTGGLGALLGTLLAQPLEERMQEEACKPVPLPQVLVHPIEDALGRVWEQARKAKEPMRRRMDSVERLEQELQPPLSPAWQVSTPFHTKNLRRNG